MKFPHLLIFALAGAGLMIIGAVIGLAIGGQ
jgi:hypothetical protein